MLYYQVMRYSYILFLSILLCCTACKHTAENNTNYAVFSATASGQPVSSLPWEREISLIEQKLYSINQTAASLEHITIDSITCYLQQGKLVKITVASESNALLTEYYYDEILPKQAYFVHSTQFVATESYLAAQQYYFIQDTLIRWIDENKQPVSDTSMAYFYKSKELLFRSVDLFARWKNHQYDMQHEYYQGLVRDIDRLKDQMEHTKYTMVGDSADREHRIEAEGFEESIRFYDAQGALAIYYTGYGGPHGTERIHEYYYQKQMICSVTENTYWQHLYLPAYNNLYGTSQNASICKTYYQQGKRFRSVSVEENTISLLHGYPQIHQLSIPQTTDY